ncbi:MAG: VanZ family protein, partial [Bacteroidota bacterium]|nr:VanZ family protein [Bacteroidota bacterium]
VLVLICLPGKDIPKIGWLTSINFDKAVHVGVFGLLTVLFCWPFYRSDIKATDRINYFIKIAIATSIWGITTEFIQRYWMPGRSFDLFDWAADSLGALIAYWFCRKKFI